MITPINVGTDGYLNSPLSVMARGYLALETALQLVGGGGSKGKRAARDSDMRALIQEDNDLLILISTITSRLIR